jgi:hypothetical protein
MQRLLAAALLACYGILGAIATGPHAHDAAPAAPWSSTDGPSWQAGAFPVETGDPAAPRAHCPLCTWSRAQVQPGMMADREPAPPIPGLGTFIPSAAGWPPVRRGVLLRAPPAV